MQREAIEQEILFKWSYYESMEHPELLLMFHIPNGGKRNATEAAHLKRQGVKAGVPDIFLPVAHGEYHGLFIELKVGTNKQTPSQKQWQQDLNSKGYKAIVCYGWQEASVEIMKYLGEFKNDKGAEKWLNL